MLADTSGPFVRLTHQNGDAYVAWVEIDQNRPPYAGVYTPVLTLVPSGNVQNFNSFECQFLRVGSTVTVSGRVRVVPFQASTATLLRISLPIFSNLVAVEDCAGTAFAVNRAVEGGIIEADATNNEAMLHLIPNVAIELFLYFHFSYQVI